MKGTAWPPPDPHKPSNGGPSGMCVAYSADGISWEKPDLPVRPGTNMVRDRLFDGNTIWLDKREPDPSRRWKGAFVDEIEHYSAYTLEASPDGIHWERIVNRTGSIEDCSRVFFNPFRKQWVFSIKTGIAGLGRQRAYWERSDLFHGPGWGVGGWNPSEPHPPPGAAFPWPTVDFADDFDPLAPKLPSGQKMPRKDLSHPSYPQVYTVDAVPFESLMIGLFVIIECDDGGKGCDGLSDHEMEVFVAFSRDGFSWSRPPAPRAPLAAMNTTNTTNWNWVSPDRSKRSRSTGCCVPHIIDGALRSSSMCRPPPGASSRCRTRF